MEEVEVGVEVVGVDEGRDLGEELGFGDPVEGVFDFGGGIVISSLSSRWESFLFWHGFFVVLGDLTTVSSDVKVHSCTCSEARLDLLPFQILHSDSFFISLAFSQ